MSGDYIYILIYKESFFTLPTRKGDQIGDNATTVVGVFQKKKCCKKATMVGRYDKIIRFKKCFLLDKLLRVIILYITHVFSYGDIIVFVAVLSLFYNESLQTLIIEFLTSMDD